MAPSTNDTKNLGGRPRTGVGTPVMVRLQPAQLSLLDAWIADQKSQPSRPEAIRILLSLVLEA
jgi:hypothetical protein